MPHDDREDGSSSEQLVRCAFERGLSGARNEASLSALESGASAITTLHSSWLQQLCPICRHTLRIGDLVQKSPEGQIRHAPGLAVCVGRDAIRSEFSADTLAFFSGLEIEWPPKAPLLRLEASHWLVAPPRVGMRRNSCFFCGHTLRPGDTVVLCPCSPAAPLCSAAMHLDVRRGLHCYTEWDPGGKLEFCPVTSRKLK